MPRAAALALALSLLPAAVSAFSFESAFSRGCHEQITRAAVLGVGWPGASRPPGLSAEDGLRLSRDLPFELPADAQNPWTLALVLGARDNDLHGYAANDFQELAAVHGAAGDQREHCLRAPADDGAEGDVTALAACRGFILGEVALAVGDDAAVDLRATEVVRLSLPFSGRREVGVQRYGWHLGRALHALQDSFAHAFRSPDGRRVRHVLNFVDPSRGAGYDEARDGHDHVAALDGCDPGSAPATRRATVATRASEEFLRAVVDDAGGAAGRLARAGAVLDAWMAVEPGCVAANRWCDAPELAEDAAAGCSARPRGEGRSRGALVAAVIVGMAALRRRLRSRASGAGPGADEGSRSDGAPVEPRSASHRRPGRTASPVRAFAALALVAALALSPSVALAQAPYEPGRLALRALASASIDRGALAVSAGVHWRVASHVSLGLTAEYNPWYSLPAFKLFAGVFSGYATAQFAWRRVGNLVLHTSVDAGATVLLDYLVGADAGTVGLYLGANILGVTVDLGRRARLVVLPASIGVPIPQLRGVPIVYQQYRFAIGVEWEL